MSPTILIVDDEAHLRMLIRQTLEDFFVQQVTAPDGQAPGGTRPREPSEVAS